MTPNLFHGQRVRLAALDPEQDAGTLARWTFDTEFQHLLDSDPARPATAQRMKAEMEKRAGRDNGFSFGIRVLEGSDRDRLIGFVGLWVTCWASAEAFVGIGLGERAYWGRGYGTDAMCLALRYAFAELNLRRVTLQAFADNPRAVRSYEKAGFVHEGLEREWIRRPDRRWDVVNMGILREDWERMNKW